MDWMLFIGIVSVGLILILFVLVMLNRAWGDFPGRISGLPPVMPPNSSPPPPSAMMSSMSSSLAGMGEIPRVVPDGGLVPVNHPMVRQAVVAAMERGGSPYALYFIKDGETVYLVPNRIADMQQREIVTRMFTSLNSSGGTIAFGDIIRVMQELGRT